MNRYLIFLFVFIVTYTYSQRTHVSLIPLHSKSARNRKMEHNLIKDDFHRKTTKDDGTNKSEAFLAKNKEGVSDKTNNTSPRTTGNPDVPVTNRSSFDGDKCPKGYVKVLGQCVKEH